MPGYNTVMEVESFKVKGLAYRPDIVLLDYVDNDLDPPNFVPQDQSYWTAPRPFLLALLRSVARGERFEPFQRFARPPRPALDSDPATVAEGLREMVGLRSYQAAMH